jgi:hypothetical protein
MDSKDLYTDIHNAITDWINEGKQPPKVLADQIMELVQKHGIQSQTLDTDYMYKWIRKHSGR